MLFRTHAPVESASASIPSSGQEPGPPGELHELAGLRQASPRQRRRVFRLCVAMVIAILTLLPCCPAALCPDALCPDALVGLSVMTLVYLQEIKNAYLA